MIYDFASHQDVPLKIAVSASSRHFKKAVDRNRIKRVMREASRLQKQPLEKLLMDEGKFVAIFFIYTAKEMPVYQDVHSKIGILLQRLTTDILKSKRLT